MEAFTDQENENKRVEGKFTILKCDFCHDRIAHE